MAVPPDQDPSTTPTPPSDEDRRQANLSFAEQFMAKHPGTFQRLAELL